MAQRSRRSGRVWELRWSAIGTLALATLALGTWGFAGHAPDEPLTTHVYRTLQLAVFETNELTGPIPWQLEIARMAAPLLAGYSALRSILLLSRDRMDLLHARRAGGHVVVCGLGDRGSRLAEGLDAAGHLVVAVEKDPNSPGIDRIRRSGVPVVIGDATDPHVLERAGIARASHLVTMCDRGAIDAEVALAARRAATSRRTALTCRLEVDDPTLARLLEQVELGGHYDRRFDLDFLDVWEAAARDVVGRFPPVAAARRAPHVVVVGLGRFGGSVVAEVARRCHVEDPSAEPVTVTVVDRRGHEALDELTAERPYLRTACRFEVCAVDATTAEGIDILKGVLSGPEPPAPVYVCLPDEAAALTVGLRSRSWLPAGSGEVVVQVQRHGGLAEALEEIVDQGAGIHAFAALDAALAPELVLGGRVELLARALHDDYRRTHPGTPAALPWDELSADLRESNRDQARHISVKLRAVGCRPAPLSSWDAAGFRFTSEELDLLGRMEHDRWVDERFAAGWTLGERREGATTSPYLVPWAALGDDIREIDRDFVRGLPGLLADAGYEIRRDAGIERGPGHA